jgi:hypothetical protein
MPSERLRLQPAPVGDPADPPLRGELRYGLELARLVCDPTFLRPWRRADAPPVLLVPGFLTGDTSLAVLRGWLRRRGDGIVSWRACLDPCARQVEVESSHTGMSVNLAVYRVLAEIPEEEPPWSR